MRLVAGEFAGRSDIDHQRKLNNDNVAVDWPTGRRGATVQSDEVELDSSGRLFVWNHDLRNLALEERAEAAGDVFRDHMPALRFQIGQLVHDIEHDLLDDTP